MIIWHVYSVSCAIATMFSSKVFTDVIVAMNTGEARDQLMAKYPEIKDASVLEATWHIHELTRFNA